MSLDANGHEIFHSIEEMVQLDYNGDEDPGNVGEALYQWRHNNPSAKVIIETRGKDRALAEYKQAWDKIHRAEYNLDEDS